MGSSAVITMLQVSINVRPDSVARIGEAAGSQSRSAVIVPFGTFLGVYEHCRRQVWGPR